jgi:hypothetical protein
MKLSEVAHTQDFQIFNRRRCCVRSIGHSSIPERANGYAPRGCLESLRRVWKAKENLGKLAVTISESHYGVEADRGHPALVPKNKVKEQKILICLEDSNFNDVSLAQVCHTFDLPQFYLLLRKVI